MMKVANLGLRVFILLFSIGLDSLVIAQCGNYLTDGDEFYDCETGPCCEVSGACNGPGTDCYNYDPDYTATGGCDLSCVSPGCTDFNALNYDPTSNADDGSCILVPENFQFVPTSGSGLLLGQLNLDGATCSSEDWIAAFDSEGNCAGAAQVLLNEGIAYAQLVIYADDGLTLDIDEGMNGDEAFTLQLFVASSSAYITFFNLVGESNLYGWSNTNGAPMPGYSDTDFVFAFSSLPYVPDCLDEAACNFDIESVTTEGCIYPNEGYDCEGNCEFDLDSDGVCDAFEVEGCLDEVACNFEPTPTDIVDCLYAEEGYDCLGQCLNDADGDETCDEFEVLGCVEPTACNYEVEATEDNGSCSFPDVGFDCNGDCLFDLDGDFICDPFEVPGCDDLEACNYNSIATDDDGSCQYPPPGYDCQGECILDLDDDGICDVMDGCVGYADACGICNGPGAIYSCGCDEIPASDCDCDGNQLDILGVCGGNCTSDLDEDGICDSEEVFGCTDNSACNYSMEFTEADDSCEYPEDGYDCFGNCLNDLDGDEVCDEFELNGCDDEDAMNFNPSATDNDGTCLYPSDPPSTFGFSVTPSSGTILGQIQVDGTPAEQYDWIAAFDEDGNCAGASGLIIYEGLAYMNLTIYGDDATTTNADEGISGGESFFLVLWDESELTTIFLYGDGIMVAFEGWTNTNGAPIPGYNDANDVYDFSLANADANCGDPQACNFDSSSTSNAGCQYADWGYDCDGNCLADSDSDGICNPFEVAGCTSDAACNFNPLATDDDASCVYPNFGYTCEGICIADVDLDGICDALELSGCMDTIACNYNPLATDSDNSCFFADEVYNCSGECNEDVDNDGICDPNEIAGCSDALACNYFSVATDDDGSCLYPNLYENCEGGCLNDSNGNGVCDELEGCMDESACNYQSENTLDDGSCLYPEFGYSCEGTCLSDADGDGVCDALEISGCTYPSACNYAALATDDDGSCTFVPIGMDCAMNCLFDADLDGICDADELHGCTDFDALNYTALATEDDGSCTYETCPSDLDGDGYINIGDVLQLLTDFGNECNENE